MKRVDLNEVASILDEHIEKGLKKENSLNKSLSFNPATVHEMHDDSPYYNPYKRMDDGSYAPHEKNYWVSQGRSPQGYENTDKFYRDALQQSGTNFRRSMESDLKKASGFGLGNANIGEVRQHADGTKWKKVREGAGLRNWELLTAPKGHGLEEEAKRRGKKQDTAGKKGAKPDESGSKGPSKDEQVLKIRAELEKKKEQEKQEKTSKKQTIQTVRDAFGDGQDDKFHEKLDQMERDVDIPKELQEKIRRRKPGDGYEAHLDEDEVSTLLSNGRFGFISAGKNPNLEKDMSHEEESQRFEKLRKDLIDRGYVFTRVTGHYEGEEDSFLVMSHDMDREDVQQLGKKYNQDSVIYGEKGKQEMHFTTGENEGKLHLGEKWAEAPEADDYFSSMKTKDGDFKFQLNFDFDKMEAWADIQGDKDLVAGGRTFKAKSTTEKHKDKGKYQWERKALHDEIIEEKMGKVKPTPKGQKPIAIFTGGGSGSGKTGVMHEAMKKHGSDLVHIDSDDIKKSIPEYNEMVERKDDNAAAFSHEESSDLTGEMVNKSIEENKPFVYDSTMKSPEKFKKMFDQLKKSGYEVHIFFADLPVEEAKKRAGERAKRTGRKVPTDIIDKSHSGAIKSLGELSQYADSTSVYSTAGDPPPRFVYGKSADGRVMKDDAYHKDMTERGHVLKSDRPEKDGTKSSKLYGEFLNTIHGLSSIGEHEDTESDAPDLGKRLEYDESDKAGNEKNKEKEEK